MKLKVLGVLLVTALVFTGCGNVGELGNQADASITQEADTNNQEDSGTDEDNNKEQALDGPLVTIEDLEITDFEVKEGNYSFKLANNSGYNITDLFIICGEREGDNATLYGSITYLAGRTTYTFGEVDNLAGTADQFIEEGAKFEDLDISLWMYNIVDEEQNYNVLYDATNGTYSVDPIPVTKVYYTDGEKDVFDFNTEDIKILQHTIEKDEEGALLKVMIKNDSPYEIFMHNYVCLYNERVRGGSVSGNAPIPAGEEREIWFELDKIEQIEDIEGVQGLEDVEPLIYSLDCQVNDKEEDITYTITNNIGKDEIVISKY